MLELNTKTFSLNASIPQEIGDSFGNPLVLFLAHKKDWHYFFTSFIILNFEKNEIEYITSYLPKNIATVENHPESEKFKFKISASSPHCTLRMEGQKSFWVFNEFSPFFLKIDREKDKLFAFTDSDIEKNNDEYVLDFGSTVYADEENHPYFYFSALYKNKITANKTLVFYRASLDFSEIEKIYSSPTESLAAPHMLRKIGSYLLSSNFIDYRFKNLKSGEIFANQEIYARYVYNSLYRKYCQEKKIAYSEEGSQKNSIKTHPWRERLDPDFDSFCRSKGRNFLEICKRNQEYSFSPLPGTIMLLNLDTYEENIFETTFGAPAHFEIDDKSGDIFVSSHNFIIFDKRYFGGPAAIDRFRLKNGKLQKISTFVHPAGYRFTSHRIFSYEGKTHICTFGQPNRLFVIDADTMELEFFEDIGEDFLSGQVNITDFLNYADLEPFTIKTIEVSPDGKYFLFMDYEYLYFYSFPKRKIIHKMKYGEGKSPDGEIDLSDFYNRTVHAGKL